MTHTPNPTAREVAERIVKAHREASPTCALTFTVVAIEQAIAKERAEVERLRSTLKAYEANDTEQLLEQLSEVRSLRDRQYAEITRLKAQRPCLCHKAGEAVSLVNGNCPQCGGYFVPGEITHLNGEVETLRVKFADDYSAETVRILKEKVAHLSHRLEQAQAENESLKKQCFGKAIPGLELIAENEFLRMALKEIEDLGYSRTQDGFESWTKSGGIAHKALTPTPDVGKRVELTNKLVQESLKAYPVGCKWCHNHEELNRVIKELKECSG